MTTRLRRHWRLVVVLCAAAVVFGRSYRFPFSILDDRTFVQNNPLVANPLAEGVVGLLTTPGMGYPHTVTVLSFALDHALYGRDPAGYHVTNVLVHLGVVVALYVLLLRLGVTRQMAGTAVAFFALHPLVTEPICWVIGRKDLLATGFLVAAFGIVVGGDRSVRPSSGRLAAVVGVSVLAMLSKPSTILAPLLFWPFIRSARPVWTRTDALVVVGPVTLAGAVIAALSLLGLTAQGAFVPRTRLEMVIDPLRAATLQLGHVLWPRELLAEYYRVPGDPSVGAMAMTAIAMLAAVGYVRWRTVPRSIERMACVLFALTYLPSAGLLPTSHWSADSYVYLPLVWLTLVLATVVPRHWPGLAGFPLVAIALGVLSAWQTQTWASPAATFAPVVARYPGEPRPLNRLAFAYGEAGEHVAAARTFVELDERFPDFPFNRGQRASSYDRLGQRTRADALYTRCAREHDVDCSAHVWLDMLNGKRSVATSRTDVVGLTYECAADTLAARSTPAVLRTIAEMLREKQLATLALRAERDAQAKEAARGREDVGP